MIGGNLAVRVRPGCYARPMPPHRLRANRTPRGLELALLVAMGSACSNADPAGATEVPDAGDDALVATDSRSGGDGSGGDAPGGDARDADTRPAADVAVDTRPTGDVAPPGDGGVTPGPTGCAPLAVTPGDVEGSPADTVAWSDSDCHPRSAALLRNDGNDAFGEHGGYLRSLVYQVAGKTRTIRGTGTHGWQGFGYIVSHYGSGGSASETQGIAGSWRTVLAGRHHAIHEFKWQISPGAPVDVTVHWVFATGRSHPLFAITYDATPAGKDVVKADSRAPYGDMAWDDGAGGDVTGVGWGDQYALVTTAGPVTPSSPWDYTATNRVPHAFEWSTPTDAEMGLVSTETFAEHVLGGDYGDGILVGVQGKTGSKLLTDIPDWEWPFQLNQYELPFLSSSHRVAWGASFGAVGQSAYTAFGKTLSGYPYQSYTVQVVLGTHGTSAVKGAVDAVEARVRVKVSATRGTVATRGVAGVGRTDEASYVTAGFDPLYDAWAIDVASNAATVSVDTGGAPLRMPTFELRGWTASAPPTTVVVAGKTLTADVDYFATVDTAGKRLWLTLDSTWNGVVTLSVD